MHCICKPMKCTEIMEAASTKYLTPQEAADTLRVTRRTVYTLLSKGHLQGRRVGSQWRIPQSEVRTSDNPISEERNGD